MSELGTQKALRNQFIEKRKSMQMSILNSCGVVQKIMN